MQFQLEQLNNTNTISELTSYINAAITTVTSNVEATAPFNEEVESWIRSELGNEDVESGSAVTKATVAVTIVAFVVQRFLF